MKKEKMKQTVDLTDAITYLPQVTEKNGKIERYVEGIIKKTKYKRYEIDETHGLYDGSTVELCLCGTWVKTTIKIVGEKYYAEGLKGFRLDGIKARVYSN